MSTSEQSKTILVTGFGPFGEHKINPSWESVKLLPDTINDYKLIKEEIEVSYETIEEKIPKLWNDHKPILVVHVGVSKAASEIVIETCANRKGYLQTDCLGKLHKTGEVCSLRDGEDCIKGSIKYEEICKYINQLKKNVKARTSIDAGRYLCEYIYYTSLNIDKNKTMFIHVPRLNMPYSAQELADGLEEIIKCALKQCC